MKRKLDFKLVSMRKNIISRRIYHGSSYVYIHIFILKRRKNKSIEKHVAYSFVTNDACAYGKYEELSSIRLEIFNQPGSQYHFVAVG